MSSDAVAVEPTEEEKDLDKGETRPIMLLLRRLIRNKENTFMNNAQIIDILEKEFNICDKSSHELEVNIYIKIIKKFLRDWPEWEGMERISMKLNELKDYEAVTKVLNHKYKNLKGYLGVMLDTAKPLAKDAVKNLRIENIKVDENIDSSDVVMEIQCTKQQLNHLFFRRPRLDLNNTVFNMTEVPPSRISLKKLSFRQILNGWCIKVSINLPHFCFERELKYRLKHVLVNKAHYTETVSNECLPLYLQHLEREQALKTSKSYSRDLVIKQLSDILEGYASQSHELFSAIHSLFEVLITELNKTFDGNMKYKVPANYRRFANQYKYVRYMCADNDESDDKRYDLQLEETVTPLYSYYIGKMEKIEKIPPVSDWLKFECTLCQVVLPLSSPCVQETLETHFNDVHANEVDWKCTHCKQQFSIEYLSDHTWGHTC